MHRACRDILETTGVRLHEQEAVALLRDVGCCFEDDNLVRIPLDLVEHATMVAPKDVAIYDRNGGPAPRNEPGWIRSFAGC